LRRMQPMNLDTTFKTATYRYVSALIPDCPREGRDHTPVQPSVRIKSKTPLSGHHPAMLVCSVYDFFPSEIKVSWLRDGQEVTSDVTSTEVMPNGDWYYQTHSYLEYTPRSGENISCVVEHASLKEPLITDWGLRHLHLFDKPEGFYTI
uniref:Ig-like domain-containing protein n=1 Tax=Astatotilapia calliptera TaxID=8154 RepID=A0A3P8RC47_ASTCA